MFPVTLHVFGGTFLLARVRHAVGSLWPGYLRLFGAILTYVVIGGLLGATFWTRLG